MRGLKITLVLAGLGMLVFGPMAQAANEGATVTAPFVVVPPTIDGQVSPGEWDAAAAAPGDWTQHGSSDPATVQTVVKVMYSVDALYLLYEVTDSEVESLATSSEKWHGLNVEGAVNSPFGWAGATDYFSFYVDPSNYPDDAPGADDYSYSLQWEPSNTAWGETDEDGNSYNFTELGRWGGFPSPLNPPLTDLDGNTVYWGGGVAWQLEGLQVVDGATASGCVIEVKVPFAGFTGYYRQRIGDMFDLGFGDGTYEAIVNGDATELLYAEYGTIRVFGFGKDADGAPNTAGVAQTSGVVSGMPAEGTVWKAQFCRYDGTTGEYVNWVGDTGGFVSRPFGNLVFGSASATDVRDAMLHQ